MNPIDLMLCQVKPRHELPTIDFNLGLYFSGCEISFSSVFNISVNN